MHSRDSQWAIGDGGPFCWGKANHEEWKVKDLLTLMNIGIGFIGYLFIMYKAGQWLMSVFLKQWEKRRKISARQRAVDALYDAFELDKVQQGTDVKITTKGDLVIMIYRKEA